MSVDKIGSAKGCLDVPFPQLPAEPAKEAPLDEYVPALNWKRQLGIDVVAGAKKPTPPSAKGQDRIKISFRLLGKRYQWTIDTTSFRVLDRSGQAMGTAHVEHLYSDERIGLKFFDITVTGGKRREFFGAMASDGSVPFACLTRHTPRAEKIKLTRIMSNFVSGRQECEFIYRRTGGIYGIPAKENEGDCDYYVDKVLRRLDDADMLNSFIEKLVPYLGRSDWRQEWAALRLISAITSSIISDDNSVEVANKLLPLASGMKSIKDAFAESMSLGSSRKFIVTMRKLLLPMLGYEDIKQRLVAAFLLLHIEKDKPLYHRFFPNSSGILNAVGPVVKEAKGQHQVEIAQALYEFSDRDHFLPVLNKLVDLAAMLLDSTSDEVRQVAIKTIGRVAQSIRSNGRLLRRCFGLLKIALASNPDDANIIGALVSIGMHANAGLRLSNDVMRLLLQQVERAEPEDKPYFLGEIANMIDSPNRRFGRAVADNVLRRLEALADSRDVHVALDVVEAFSIYLLSQNLRTRDLYRAAVVMKRVADIHSGDKKVLSAISSNCALLIESFNADARTLGICYQLLAPLVRDFNMVSAEEPSALGLLNSLGALVGNVKTPKEAVEDALKILFKNLTHTDNLIRHWAVDAFTNIRWNHNMSSGQLKEISTQLFARLSDEKDDGAAGSLIDALAGICENRNAGPLLPYILYEIVPHLDLKGSRRGIGKRVHEVLRAVAMNNRLPAVVANPFARILRLFLSDERILVRIKARQSLGFLIKRFPNVIDEEVKEAWRIHHVEDRYSWEGSAGAVRTVDVVKIRKDLEDADPLIREWAASEAKFAFLTPEVLRSNIKRLNSLPELRALMHSLEVSSHDSDYYVQYESKVSKGIIAFVVEDKRMAEYERQPMIVVPDLSGEANPPSQIPGSTYKQKQHYIFRRFAIIPLNNTRRFSDNELKLIYKGLKALPYEVLGGFYSVMADDLDYDRHVPRGLFDRGQVKFQGRKVTMRLLFHEIGHSVFKSVLTEEQRDRFILLNEASGTDISNFANDYATQDVDEDFTGIFEEWTSSSWAFWARGIRQYRAGKPILLEKVLLAAEVLASGGDFVPAYRVRGAKINKKPLSITRYNDAKIKTITVGGVTHEFEYDAKDRLFKMDGKKPW